MATPRSAGSIVASSRIDEMPELERFFDARPPFEPAGPPRPYMEDDVRGAREVELEDHAAAARAHGAGFGHDRLDLEGGDVGFGEPQLGRAVAIDTEGQLGRTIEPQEALVFRRDPRRRRAGRARRP